MHGVGSDPRARRREVVPASGDTLPAGDHLAVGTKVVPGVADLLLTGWQNVGAWYYLAPSGAMLTGWQQIGGTWYYFGTGGDMYTGGHWIGWRWYTFGSDGRWLG